MLSTVQEEESIILGNGTVFLYLKQNSRQSDVINSAKVEKCLSAKASCSLLLPCRLPLIRPPAAWWWYIGKFPLD